MLLADLGSTSDTTASPRLLSRYTAVADLALRVLDLATVVAWGVLAYRLIFGTWGVASSYRVAIGTALLYSVICFSLFPLYRSWRVRGLLRELMVLGAAFGGIFALFSVHALIVHSGTIVSRSWIALWFIAALATLVAFRTVLRGALNRLRSEGVDVQRVVVVGLRHPVMKIQQYLSRNPWVGLKLVGYFRSPHDLSLSERWQTLPCLGEAEMLADYLRANRVEQVWIALPLGEREQIKQLLRDLDRHPLHVKLVPDLFDFGLLNQSGEQIGSVPVINLRQGANDGDGYFVLIKALQDKVVALLALSLLWPLLLLIAVGVKLSSPGPVFFRQRRNGLGGCEFQMMKFRSMRVHDTSNDDVMQATRNDQRVTRFGAFLRRTSLDELPQIFNVLGGSMSIVGPRPHAAQHNSHYEKLINRYMQRHYVKPGITGWAQVNGFRGETPELRTMKKRIQYDLDYIRRWSLWLDVRIIFLTAFKVLGQKNAY